MLMSRKLRSLPFAPLVAMTSALVLAAPLAAQQGVPGGGIGEPYTKPGSTRPAPAVSGAAGMAGAPAAPGAPAVAATKPKPAAGAGKSEAAASGGGDAGLRQRVEQLEEQLVDLQVVIGTLESLAKGGGVASGAAAVARSGGGDMARMEALEAQLRQLSAQVTQLAAEVRQGGGRDIMRRSDLPPAGRAAAGGAGEGDGGSSVSVSPPPRFGSTTVSTTTGDPIGSLLQGGPGGMGGTSGPGGAPGGGAVVAAAPAGADPGNAKQLYETAYGYLLQQDYGAAETAFDDFLKRYPNDSVAGKAQYWLGETFFVRGQYKQAAAAFLKGYQSYGRSATAPDSFLKFAMSMDRLGQKDAACSSLGELATRFPTAPAHIKDRAQSERQRVGCP